MSEGEQAGPSSLKHAVQVVVDAPVALSVPSNTGEPTPSPSVSPRNAAGVQDPDEYAARLRTYELSPHAAAWRALPPDVNGFACARRGWAAQERTLHAAVALTATCTTCHAFLTVSVAPEFLQTKKAAVAACKAKLATAHASSCPFRSLLFQERGGAMGFDTGQRRSEALMAAPNSPVAPENLLQMLRLSIHRSGSAGSSVTPN